MAVSFNADDGAPSSSSLVSLSSGNDLACRRLARSSEAALGVELSRLLTPKSVRPVSSPAKVVVVEVGSVMCEGLRAGRALSTVSYDGDLIVVAMIVCLLSGGFLISSEVCSTSFLDRLYDSGRPVFLVQDKHTHLYCGPVVTLRLSSSRQLVGRRAYRALGRESNSRSRPLAVLLVFRCLSSHSQSRVQTCHMTRRKPMPVDHPDE